MIHIFLTGRGRVFPADLESSVVEMIGALEMLSWNFFRMGGKTLEEWII